MTSRGIRGAITVEANTRAAIVESTEVLLTKMLEANELALDDIACAFFTTTRDLNAEFPAVAARKIGWGMVPLMCGHEMEVPGSLQSVVRVMLVANTEKRPDEITHIYLKEAQSLRPEMADGAKA